MATYAVPITKAGNKTIDIDAETIPDEMYRLALAEGLKVLLNKGMSKVTTAKLEGDELAKAQAAAYAIGEKNAEAIRAGTMKVGRKTKAAGVSGAVMTEARRLAKAVVKDALREAKIKISTVAAKEITEAANKLIEADASFIEKAKANLAEREQIKPKLDIAGLVSVSPELVQKAEAKKAAAKAERATQLSAKQAGKVAPKAKAKPAPQATA